MIHFQSVRNFSIILQDLEVNLSSVNLSGEQETRLNDIAKSCRKLLTELEETIRQHGGVIPDSVRKTHKLGSMWKRLKWDPNHVRDLRDRISANVGIVNAMINILNSTAGHITRRNVEALLRSKDHEKWEALLEWLCPDTYTAQQYANMHLR